MELAQKINRPQIQNLFLAFMTKTNVVLIGNVGLGKTHLSIALGHAAVLVDSVLFTTAVEHINTLAAAHPPRPSQARVPPLPELPCWSCR